MSEELALKRPALYNPALWSRAEVRDYFVARQSLLARLVEDVRREGTDGRPQHRLILGLRGMGKSTLLRRLAIAIEDDTELAARWLPLTFPEEQYNVANLADFWLNCLDALGDLLEQRGEKEAMEAIDAEVERLGKGNADAALQALLKVTGSRGKRLLLLVDNIDLILDRLKKEDWALRDALQDHSQLMLVGASSRALEATYNYKAAFYDFFKVDELRGLTEQEMRETILNLARLRGAEEVARKVEADPVRLRVLHTLTGGNPRTAVLLYGVLLKGADGDVRTDLEGLLDEVTPLYKARFEELPPVSQQLLDKLALHWDPMTARQLADALGWEVNLVSAQLSRLGDAGVVEKVKAGKGKRAAFQVGERFFNIWYLMRASRRVRRRLIWLVEFLRMYYSGEELRQNARKCLQDNPAGVRGIEYSLALSRALGPEPLARALESLLAGDLKDQVGEVLDLQGEDKDLLPKAERIKTLAEIRENLQLVCVKNPPPFPSDQLINLFVEMDLPLELKRKVVELSEFCSAERWIELLELVRKQSEQIEGLFGRKVAGAIASAIACGEMTSIDDVEGAAAAAERFSCPPLNIIGRLDELAVPGNNPSAKQLLEDAVAISPDGAVFSSTLGMLLVRSNEGKDGIDYLRKATEISPSVFSTWLTYGVGQLIAGSQFANALSALRQAYALAPDEPEVTGMLTIALFANKNADEALLVFRELLETVQESDENTSMLSSALSLGLMEGRGSEMLRLLDQSEAAQRWRPLREALAAAVAGDPEILNGVAPEVRLPALEILKDIAPDLQKDAQ